MASKVDASDRWALAVAGLLGDDRIVLILSQQIREWADSSRGKMAEYAVEALALLGTDAALLTRRCPGDPLPIQEQECRQGRRRGVRRRRGKSRHHAR